ncbi:MAG: serine/threonine-protein kinase [Gracilimonas sp.]|nr:serine/threonine-protein kinase [Gracilimonas sp.]
MDTEQWQQIEKIIDLALELDIAKRKEFVQQQCKHNPELYDQVINMLDYIQEVDDTDFLKPGSLNLKTLLKNFDSDASVHSFKSLIGKRISHFTLTELLGEGGMATVYKGERQDGSVNQIVAIKILYNNLQSNESHIRFKVEQEILANLTHSNIAHFLDAGITEEGNPYLIMEFVDGMPISEYCRSKVISQKEKLKLFKNLCSAVGYAHRNLVVHRDLKPNNIYVTNDGQVKVLDFSIAKLLDPDFSSQNMVQTRTGLRLLSPAYSAPEQFMSEPITTATDVYTLGLVLYEIVTGNRAVESKKKSLKEIEQLICGGNLDKTLTHSKELDSDLKSIILKAIRKEPEYRYESASQLLEDINNYEDELPVTAQNGTAKYRISKFSKRHWKSLSTAMAVLLLFVTTGFIYTYQIKQESEKAAIEAKRAQVISNFLFSIFNSAAVENYTKNPTAEQLLENGSKIALTSFENQPQVKEYLLRNIGNIYSDLGYLQKANNLLNNALSLCENSTDRNSELRANCYNDYGSFQVEIENFDKAKKYLTLSSEIISKFPNNKELKAINLAELGWVAYNHGNLSNADSLVGQSLAIKQSIFENRHSEIGLSLLYLGWIKNAKGKYRKADSLFTESIEIFELYTPKKDFRKAHAMNGKGRNLYDLNRMPEADSVMQISIPLNKKVYGEYSTEYATALRIMGLIKTQLGQYDESQRYLEQALEKYAHALGRETSMYNNALNDLALVHFHKKEYQKSIDTFKTIISLNKQILGETHPEIATGLSNLATILDITGNSLEAIPYFNEALKVAKMNYRDSHPKLIRFRNNAAKAYLNIDEFETAQKMFLKSFDIVMAADEMTSEDIAYNQTLNGLIDLYSSWDKKELEEKYTKLLSQESENQ